MCCCSSVQAQTEHEVQVLAPHRVVYEIALSDKKSGVAQPASLFSLSGRMVYEMTGDVCDGYSMTQRLVTSSELTEGEVALEDVQLASFESPKGEGFQFATRRLLNQKLRQTLRGSAESAGESTQLSMKEPVKQELILPHKALFPMGYLRAMIAAAKGGETIVSAYLFDGADRVGEYYHATASIGRERIGPDQTGALALMQGKRHWPVTIAYFIVGEQAEDMTPLYEISTELYENGVNSDLYLDFGDYALDATVTDLELLPQPDCRQSHD